MYLKFMNCQISKNFRDHRNHEIRVLLLQTNDHCHDGDGGHDRDQTVPKIDDHLYDDDDVVDHNRGQAVPNSVDRLCGDDDDGDHRQNSPNKDNGGYRGDGDVPDMSNHQDTDHNHPHEFPKGQKSTGVADWYDVDI